ncbi:tRNA (cytidine(34)-2'-O)-methyltransferase [Sphingomonas montana]|uniref:tRNA (cytidine(34)-2'-O)-methyltransferase n=1 Tax=Sphingomonas montana TaxID=1843236 RepID=UPI00096E223F|nr:tRNA (cytidine(34)-2'-O)-methyltransferase [Sphingomonas montana]
MRICLHQPDIAGNVGTILRLAACLGVGVDIVEPCGFPFSDRALRRAGMDYADRTEIRRHADWDAFRHATPGRIVLLTTAGGTRLDETRFAANDIVLMGAEGSGVPPHVHDAAALRVRIPMRAGYRSLNVAVAAGIALAEALRQTAGWPADPALASASAPGMKA